MRFPPSGRLAAVVAAGLLALAAGPEARQPRQVSLIVSGGIVLPMDGRATVINPGSVAIDGTQIVAVGPAAEIAAAYSSADTIDATGRVVMPGLINTHTHAPMVMFRGLADDLALMDWLQKYIFPAEATLVSPEFVRVGTRLAALEMIRSGTTTFTDMYYFEDVIAREARNAGLRGVLGQTVIQFPVADAKTPAEALARAARFIDEFAGDPLITPAVAPHAPYTLDTATLLACRDLAMRKGVPLLIHLAETEDEVKAIEDRSGLRPVGYLDKIGFWGPRIVAAHGVWVDDAEIDVLKRNDVGIAHNPESNMKLASGTAPVPAYLAKGVAVGLGTDGAASNNDLDMFEAMRQAAFVHKLVSRDPTAVSARTALEMATAGGARVLGRASDLGTLEAGKLADLIVVRMDQPRQTPMYNPESHLVYTTRGDDVETTIVNGRILMRDRVVLSLDEAAVLADARKMAESVRQAVAPQP
ncbi:MAG: amidohydrolase [Vicinamibacterales bacterium]